MDNTLLTNDLSITDPISEIIFTLFNFLSLDFNLSKISLMEYKLNSLESIKIIVSGQKDKICCDNSDPIDPPAPDIKIFF